MVYNSDKYTLLFLSVLHKNAHYKHFIRLILFIYFYISLIK